MKIKTDLDKMNVIGNRICVSSSIPAQVRNGIFIPDSAKDEMAPPHFTVEALGDGDKIPEGIKIGTKVLCSKYEYSTKLDEKLLFFVNLEHVISWFE